MYEFLQFENEWLDFYKNLGINLFVWNYRGFGRSEGTPYPKKLCSDGEVIIDHLRNQRRVQKMIGVHGQSLGGYVACHLARNCRVDFVFIDRSFSSLEKVSECMYGKLAKNSLKLITLGAWKCETVENFVLSNVYKVVSCDPRDEIIHDISSLKNGITKNVIYSEVSRKENRLSHGPNKRREVNKIKFEDYCHIINLEETRGFFKSLKYVYELVLKFASSDTSRSRRQNPQIPADDYVDVRASADTNTGLAVNNSVEFDNQAHEFISSSANTLETMLSTDRSNTEMTSSFLNETDETLDDSRRLSLSYTFDENDNQIDEERKAKKMLRKEKKKRERKASFLKIDDSNNPTNYDVLNRFLLRFHKLLDRLDSAGRTLRHIFEEDKKHQFDLFRMFIMNLEVFGSYLPLNDRLFDPQVTKISSYLKV